MTHRTGQGLVVLVGIGCLGLSVFVLLVSSGLAGQQANAQIPKLLKALGDRDEEVRRGAARALEELGEAARPAVPALLEALEDAHAAVRRQAIQALGFLRLGAEAGTAIPAFIKALNDEDFSSYAAARALASTARALQEARATAMIGPLHAALDALNAHPEYASSEETATVKQAVDSLELLWWRNLQARLRQGVRDHPYLTAGLAVYPVLLLGCLICHGLRPLWLYRLNEALKPYTDVALPFGGLKLPLRFVLLVGFFQYSRRILDAWIAQHLMTAREEFQREPTVSDRAVHIPVPVRLDGQTILDLTAEPLRPTFNKHRACLLIWGEGGAGKTSLACQVGRWAMADTPTERLCAQHPMLPILIEQELEAKDTAHPQPFLEAIRGELRVLTNAEEPLPEAFVRRLLQHRRLLVIVDHFSEMSEAARQAVRPSQPDFPANALIVTSRLEERLDGVPKSTIQPMRIERDHLSSFMEAYLTQRGKRECFTDKEYFEACGRLSEIVGTRDTTVLLAKLYAEQMIAAKAGVTEGTLPDTIPDLMLSYVNEVNRGVEHPKLEDRTVHRVAKVMAWECLKRTYRPTPAPREDVLTALRGEQAPEALLAYLEDRLRLIQTVGAGRNQIRFALDPLAEYLAGLYVVEAYGDNVDTWKQFFARAEGLPGAPAAIAGFLLAVRDCCLAQGTDATVPAMMAGELAKRAGVEADVVRPGPA